MNNVLTQVMDLIGLSKPEVLGVQIKIWHDDKIQVVNASHNPQTDEYTINIRENPYPTGLGVRW